MARIAVIGGGVSGLTAAYVLARDHQVTVMEANDYLGGHTHTHEIELEGKQLQVDTGFIVYNDRTYPNFIHLLDKLGCTGRNTEMSFSVNRPGLEYSGHNLNTLFAQRRNLVNKNFLRMVLDILRFNRNASLIDSDDNRSLGEYLSDEHYSAAFQQDYISATLRIYIETQAARRNLDDISVLTADMSDFSSTDHFDRVMSIEMFEHMRNYQILFQRISSWLKPDGKLFFHIFCHRNMPYFFETASADDWMAKHFFMGGMMPSFDLPAHFNDELNQEGAWEVNGLHYADTCAAWLKNLDRGKADAIEAISRSDNPASAIVQFNRWRLFVMACQELFKYKQGTEWHVAYFVFVKAAAT